MYTRLATAISPGCKRLEGKRIAAAGLAAAAARLLHPPVHVQPYIQVSFPGSQRDPALEAAIHRWVARLEAALEDASRVDVKIERGGRRGTLVGLTLSGGADGTRTAATAHNDAYIAVSDAFRALRMQLLRR